MKKHTFLILILSLSIIACEEKPLAFVKLDQFSKIDTLDDKGRRIYFKTDVYIVKNYTDNLKNERAVDSFAYHNRAKDLASFSDYSIVIYKHSNHTNADNLAKHPKDFDSYGFENDMIYIYSWRGGTWSSKTKLDGRAFVEAQPMIRED